MNNTIKASMQVCNIIQTINVPIKAQLLKSQTLGIQFIITRAVYSSSDTESLIIDNQHWCIRDAKSSAVMCMGKTQKDMISRFMIMLQHPKFMNFYNLRVQEAIARKEITV